MKRFIFPINAGFKRRWTKKLFEVYKPNRDKLGEVENDLSLHAKIGVSYLFDFSNKKTQKQ